MSKSCSYAMYGLLAFVFYISSALSDEDFSAQKEKLLNLITESENIEIRKDLLDIYGGLDQETAKQTQKLCRGKNL